MKKWSKGPKSKLKGRCYPIVSSKNMEYEIYRYNILIKLYFVLFHCGPHFACMK